MKAEFIKLCSLALVISLYAIPLPLFALESGVWLGYQQEQKDYLDDNNSPITNKGSNIGGSFEITNNWQVSLSFSKSKGEASWSVADFNSTKATNTAKIESQASLFKLIWLSDDYSLSFGYAESEFDEQALTRQPLVSISIEGKDKIYSFAYDAQNDVDNWLFNWGLGIQYADISNNSSQTNFTDPKTYIKNQFNETSWGAFIDLGIAYWFEAENFAWTPQFTVSWNAEISNDGNPYLVIAHGGKKYRFAQNSNLHQADTFRQPDSGFWQASVMLMWSENWTSTIGYSETISAEVESESLAFDLSYSF